MDIKPSFKVLTILAAVKYNLLPVVLIFQSLIFITGSQKVLAQELIIKERDLCDTWKVFDSNTKTYNDFSPVGRTTSIRFDLALNEDVNSWLEISAPEGTSILINGKYSGRITNKRIIDLDSLIGASNRNVFDFTIFRSSGLNTTNLSTFVYERVSDNDDPVMRKEPGDDFMNYYVLASVLILMFIGFLSRKFPRDTRDYFSFFRSLSFKNREETLISSRPFNRTNVLFIIFDSILIGFLIVSFVHLASGHVYFPFIRKQMAFSELIIGWLGSSLVVFFSIIIKYLVVIIFNNLFRLGEFRYIQHFNSLRYSIGAFLLIFILTTCTFLAVRMEGLQVYYLFTRILAVLLLIRILVMFFKLRDFTSFRNFHLFSYLCGTEIIPFIILYKLVLG